MRNRISRFGLIALFAAVFSASSAYATSSSSSSSSGGSSKKTFHGKVTATASPTGAGKVYVTLNENETPAYDNTSSKEVKVEAESQPKDRYTFWIYTQPSAGYEFTNYICDDGSTASGPFANPWGVSMALTVNDAATKSYTIVFSPKTYYGKAEAGISSGYAGTAGGTVSMSTSSTAGSYSTSASVTYNSAPGAASASQTVYYFAKPNAGYVFIGWSTSASGTTANYLGSPYSVSCSYSSTSSGSPTTATKLYAVFCKNPDYLSFKAVDGSVTVGMTNALVRLEYAASKSGPWTTIDFAGGATLTIPSGTTYYFRSTLATTLTPNSTYGIGQFTMTGSGKIDAGGEITSLIDAYSATTTLKDWTYKSLFWGCQNLRTAPSLPATTLGSSCYYEMFKDCTSLTVAPALPATTLSSFCYQYMFMGCTSLMTAPDLTAMTLEMGCYSTMFSGCTSLTVAPMLPATKLASYCYYYMFEKCTSLTAAPALPATTLMDDCYRGMFNCCTSLMSAPTLPATKLASGCYNYMFFRCTSLTTAPALPATTLTEMCYFQMFACCYKLNLLKVNFTNWAADQKATSYWLEDCAGVFVGPAELDMTSRTTHTVPPKWNIGWDVGESGSNVAAYSDATGKLTIRGTGKIGNGKFPADIKSKVSSVVIEQGVTGASSDAFAGMTLNSATLPTSWTGEQFGAGDSWYGAEAEVERDYLSFTAVGGSVTVGMTNALVSLKYSTTKLGPWTEIDFAGGATLTIPSGTTYYFRSTYSSGGGLSISPKPNSTYGIGQFTMSGTGKIDAGGLITSLIDAKCAKTDVSSYQYKSLFWGCQNLRTAPALPATTLASQCYYNMFYGCTSLTTAPALPATTLANSCYFGMFERCTLLMNAPALPATTLAVCCYEHMFYKCHSLAEAPVLPATTLAASCYEMMFLDCPSLTAAPALPATTLAARCYYQMFVDCTSLTVAPVLPATTLANSCYCQMFQGTALTSAPTLPATTLTNKCYYAMFSSCTKLNSVKVNFTDWAMDLEATKGWLWDNVGTFVCPAELDLSTRTTSTVPPKWKIAHTAVTLESAAQRYPWNNIVDYTYSVSNLLSGVNYKLAVELTANGTTKGVTNELTTVVDGTYTKSVDLTTLFGSGTKDPEAKIDLSLIETIK